MSVVQMMPALWAARRWRSLLGLALLVAILLSGCAGQGQPAAQTAPTALAASAAGATPTAPSAPSLVPTATPRTIVPPTAPPTAVPQSPTAVPPSVLPSPTIISSPTPPPPTALEEQELVGALGRGGYIIAFRHAATDWSQRDTRHTRELWPVADPRRMRQLAEQGRAQARAIGAALRALGVPVGQVLASPYHRTQETAELLALGPVETSADVVNMYAAEHVGGRAQLVATARQRLATLPPSGTNTVIVTHGNVVQAAANITLQEGEAAIVAPNGVDGFAVVARVLPEKWTELAQADVQASARTTAVAAPTRPTGAIGAICEPTPADGPGRFYTPNAPVRARVGRGYVLSGFVRSTNDCTPLPDARIELWLAGPDGSFDADHRATVIAGASGAYRFESNFPPAVDGDPPHIFVRVTAPAHRPLVTRHYPITGQSEGTFDLIMIPEQ